MPGPVMSFTTPLFLYRITIRMTASCNVLQHGHYYLAIQHRTAKPLPLMPDVSTTLRLILGRSRQLGDLIQQSLILPGSVLQDLVPEVINLLARGSRWVALFEVLWLAMISTQMTNLPSAPPPPTKTDTSTSRIIKGTAREINIPEQSGPC